MKINSIKILVDKIGKVNFYLSLIVFILILSMSFGYAAYNSSISAISQVTLKKRDYLFTNKVEFVDYEIADLGYNIEGSISVENKDTASGVNVITKVQAALTYKNEYNIKYTLYNGTSVDYTYLGSDGVLSLSSYSGENVEIKYPRINGITKGDIIHPGEYYEINVIFIADCGDLYTGSYPFLAELTFSFKRGVDEDVIKPSIVGSFDKEDVVLNSNNIANITMYINNLYDCSQKFSLSLSNPSIELLSSSGDYISLSRIIDRSSMETIAATLRFRDNFGVSASTDVLLTTETGIVYNLGTIDIVKDHDKDMELLDNFSVDIKFSHMDVWEGHSSLVLNLINNNDFEITQFRIRLAISPDAKIISGSSSTNTVEIDEERNIITVISGNPYTDHYHVPIAANGSLIIDDVIIEHSGNSELSCIALEVDAMIDGQWHLGMMINGIAPIGE